MNEHSRVNDSGFGMSSCSVKTLKPAPKTNMQELCSRTVQMLMKANHDGRLSAALTELQQVPKPTVLAPIKEDVEELRSRMAQVLMHATSNGRLFTALDQSEKRAAQKMPPATKQPKMNVEELRARAAQVLLDSCATGQLSKVMEEINSNAQVEAVQPSRIDAVRMKVAHVLSTATADGRLSALLGELAHSQRPAARAPAVKMLMPPPSNQDICSRTAQLLTEAAFDGSLYAALADSLGFGARSNKLPVPSGSPSTLGPVPIKLTVPQRTDISKMRSQMAQLLVQCASDGRLHTALDDMLHTSSRNAPPQTPVVCIEKLRLQTGKLLLASVSSGRLSHVLNEVQLESQQEFQKEPAIDIEDLRFRTGKLLFNTACDGRLHSALRDIQGPQDPVEKHRVQAASALHSALHNGRLPLLKEVAGAGSVTLSQASLEEQRKHAASAFLSALSDGRLSSALQDMRPFASPQSPSASIEASRAKVAQLLVESMSSGRLSTVLQEMQRPKQVDIEELRLQTGHLLLNAMSDGRLAKALHEMQSSSAPQHSALDRCRQRTAQLLTSAESDGRLVSALVEMRAEKQKEAECQRVSEADVIRDRAARALIRGEADGRLSLAFQKMKEADQEVRLKAEVAQVVPAPSNEPTRSRLAQVFAQGASSGRLDLAVQAVSEQQRARTEKSLAASGALAQTALLLKRGIANGDLDKALANIMAPTEGKVDAPEAPKAPLPNSMKPAAPVEAPPAAPPLEVRTPVKPPGSRVSARPGRPVRPGSAMTARAEATVPDRPPAHTVFVPSPPPTLEESPVPQTPTAPPTAPSTPFGSGPGFRRRQNKAAPQPELMPFQIDTSDAKNATSTPRKPSLSRGYDALSVGLTPAAGSRSVEIDWKASLGPAPAAAQLDLGSRQQGRFGSSSWGTSAMAMDLEGDAAPRSSQRSGAASLGPRKPSTPQQHPRATSLGPKSLTKAQGVLPGLSARGRSDPLAWSMGVSRPKWGGTVF